MLLAQAALACSLVVGPACSDVRGGVPRLSRPVLSRYHLVLCSVPVVTAFHHWLSSLRPGCNQSSLWSPLGLAHSRQLADGFFSLSLEQKMGPSFLPRKDYSTGFGSDFGSCRSRRPREEATGPLCRQDRALVAVGSGEPQAEPHRLSACRPSTEGQVQDCREKP